MERRGLRRDEHEVGGEEHGAMSPAMRGGPSIDEMTGVSRKLRRLAAEPVAGKADEAEEARQTLPCALF